MRKVQPKITSATPTVLTEAELSERWKMSVRTLQFWRYRKTGPKYIKIHGRAVRYPMDAILAYEMEAGIEPLDETRGDLEAAASLTVSNAQ